MRRGIGVFTGRKSIAAFNRWREIWSRARESEGRARGALARMMSAEGKGFNTWQTSWAAGRENEARIAGSLARMASPAGKAFNSWLAWWVEHSESKAKLAAALARMSPEGRAKLAVIHKLQALIVAAQAAHRAMQAFRLAAPRKAFNTWHHAEGVRLTSLQAAVWLVARSGQHAAALYRQLATLERSTVDEFIGAVDKPGPEGITPLLWAAKSGFGEVVDVLLKLSSDPASLTSAVNEDGSSPLHLAAREGYIDCVRHLLESGANVNATNATDSSTALHWAASKNHAQVCSLLVKGGADTSLVNKWKATALSNAEAKDNYATVILLTDDPAVRIAAEAKAQMESKLRPSAEERMQLQRQMTCDIQAQRVATRDKQHYLEEARLTAKATERQTLQAERLMKIADSTLVKVLSPAASKKAASRHDGEPWLEYTPQEHEDLRRGVGEAQAAGNANHLIFGERLKQASRLLAQLDAHTAGKTIPHAATSPSAKLGPKAGSPVKAAAETILDEWDMTHMKKLLRKSGIKGKAAAKNLSKEVRL